MDKLPGARAAVQREQNHVVQLLAGGASASVGEQGGDFRIVENAQPAGVASGNADAAPPPFQDGRIGPAEQHEARVMRGGRFQREIVNLAHCLEDMQDGLRREGCVRVVFVAAGKRPLGGDVLSQGLHVSGRDVRGGPMAQNR